MTNQPSMDDPQTIWQNQPAEEQTVSIEMLSGRARRLESRVNIRKAIFLAALTAHILFEVAPHLFGLGPSRWLGLAQLATFIVWVIYYPYVFAGPHRFITLSTELAAPGLAFYRKQLESLTDDYPAKLQVGFIAYYMVIHAYWNPALIIPIGVLGGIWAYYSRKRESDNAKDELKALAEFRKQDPS